MGHERTMGQMTELFIVVFFFSGDARPKRTLRIVPSREIACGYEITSNGVQGIKARASSLKPTEGGHVFPEMLICKQPSRPNQRTLDFDALVREVEGPKDGPAVRAFKARMEKYRKRKEKPKKTGFQILLEIAACETDCEVCLDFPARAGQFLDCAEMNIMGLTGCKARCRE